MLVIGEDGGLCDTAAKFYSILAHFPMCFFLYFSIICVFKLIFCLFRLFWDFSACNIPPIPSCVSGGSCALNSQGTKARFNFRRHDRRVMEFSKNPAGV